MKVINYFKIPALLVAAFIFFTAAAAQDSKPVEGQEQNAQRPTDNRPQDIRGNALRQLGLSHEQIQQIRRITAQRKPLMEDAQKRLREANRALDETIYADQVSETDVQARLKEVQLAQAEVAKIRFMNEFAIRRILTPEQLVRFRELRQRFEQMRQNNENRRPANRQMQDDRARPAQDVQQPGRRFQKQNLKKPIF